MTKKQTRLCFEVLEYAKLKHLAMDDPQLTAFRLSVKKRLYNEYLRYNEPMDNITRRKAILKQQYQELATYYETLLSHL